ncbi:AfsR/SARP family transcriptional regulator [Actinorugispora endophytica]|uniref:DNA-binding SARP family transcriptional activator n=1 Tax=Actinorugispora endophytica TaxID=1605990 RepID=A0A4R6V5D7_9ACTN|nr:tetratricopeptide repeat protein [Actinorugispora endophytica]TDQ55433.1 DNA-binding SARP family transcriptional activator [Actinorugispora endophytica]
MEFGVLGPVAAWRDGEPVSVGGPRQRCVLGALLADLGREVPFDRLVEFLWDDRPPRTAKSVIHVQISHLRRAFPELIRTTAGGYLAQTDPDRVDLHRFRALAGRARESGDAEEAVRLWEEALACWRGRPFSGTGSDRLWYAVGGPLLEERWAAVTAWAEAGFALGRYAELATRLAPLVREDLSRERLHYLLVASMHRSGERAGALAAYHELRGYLAEELGIDPGQEVRDLYQRIVTDTEERAPAPVEHAEAPPDPDPPDEEPPPFASRNDLPRDIPDFTGREHDLGRVLEAGGAGGAEACVITGPGGAGKTTLAIHAAHRLTERYPDGQFFIDLYGHTVDQEPVTADTALGSLLRAVGLEADAVPDSLEERAALWRSILVDRRVLVVLDNAVNYAQVGPLLPASAGSLTLITSRNDLAGLSGARYVSLGMLRTGEAEALLSAVLGPERTSAEPVPMRRVVKLCGGLPLALRIVAGRMATRPKWTFAHVEQRLSGQHRRFRELRTESHSVEAVFELSYQSLNDAQKDAFLRLGLMIGSSIDVHGAAELVGRELPDTDDLLQELVSVCLLEEQNVDLYRFHDLIGEYARHKAVTRLADGVVEESRLRLSDYYLRTADRAAGMLGPRGHDYELDVSDGSRYRTSWSGWAEAAQWFDWHRENLAAVVGYFAEHKRGTQAWQLANSLWRFYAGHGQTELWLTTHEQALEASRADSDDMGTAVTLVGLGIAHCLSGRFDLALSLLVEARDLFTRLGDRGGEARATANMAMVYERMGRYTESLDALREVLDHAVEAGDTEQEIRQRTNMAVIHQSLGEFDQAVEHCDRVLAAGSNGQPDDCRAAALRVLGEINIRLGRNELAHAQLQEALELFLALEDSAGEIYTRDYIGVVLRETGRLDEAVAAHLLALELGERSAQRSAEAEILNDLGTTYARGKRYEEARLAHERALRLAGERHELFAEARALHGLAGLPSDVIGADTAEAMLERAVEVFAGLGVPEAETARADLRDLRGVR